MDENNIVIKELIPHVFLPLRLPGEASGNIIAEENCLLSLLLQTIRATETFIPQIRKTLSVFETWVDVQGNGEREPSRISNAIKTMQPGQLFALYVRAQNCGLLISIPEGDRTDAIIWSAFPASQKSETVTGSSGDLLVSYPATSIEVKRSDVLHSESFARQLSVLISQGMSEAMPVSEKAGELVPEIRDVPDTRFVSGWLSSLIVTQDSIQSFGDIPQIAKKIRDSVVLGQALIPFRRSGLWTTAKVVLNICLIRDLDDIRGLFLYKIVILRLMLTILESSVFPLGESTGIEMLKKVGRRIRKLEKLKDENTIAKSDLKVVYDRLVEEATKVITSARSKIDQHWKSIIDAAKQNSTISLTGTELKTIQTLSGSGLLNYLTSSSEVQVKTHDIAIPHVSPRHRINLPEKYSHTIPKSVQSVFGIDISIILFDFERNVWENWNDVITLEDSDYVWRMYHQYTDSALDYYKNDPVGMSRLIITTLKMIQIWDQCVCNQYPLLRTHKIGIRPTFVHMLLVATKEELKIVNSLEAYFRMRENAPNSSLLEQIPDSDSFSVKFAAQNSDMETVREQILEEGRKRAQEKMDEVRRAKSYCESLRSKISGLTHKYYITCYRTGAQAHDIWDCELCRLTKELDNYRVKVYEKPLPEHLHLQQAIVFELLIPSVIASLRDLLLTFGRKIVTSIGCDKDTVGTWCEDFQLRPHNRRLSQWFTNLVSTTKHFVDSHYKERHPDYPIDDFISNNGYNVNYGAFGKTINFRDEYGCHIKDWCTLKVECASQYALMQWAINGNSQTPNDVLARQSECHRNMSKSEFVEFGSLRCYNKQQIRNLIRATVMGTLSFKNESVFNLVCQSLWECSPFSLTENGVREAHEDFLDSTFLTESLVIMEKLLAKHSDNWQDHYVLLMVIVFAVNVAEKSDNQAILDAAGTLILKCRNVSQKWSKNIQEITSKMTSEDTKEKDKLTLKLVEVNICSAFSFGAHKRLGSRTFGASEHIKGWLQAIVVVYDHMMFVTKNASTQTISLMRRVIEFGVDIEIYLNMSNGIHRGLNMFLRSNYGGADNLDFNNETPWMFYEMAPQVYYLEVTKSSTNETVTLQLDIVFGNFLVNGCTVCRLPQSIEQHKDYERLFPTMSFEVQPLAPNEAVTKHAYEGSYYSFKLVDELLIVEEIITGTSTRRTLVPSKYLPSNFPHQFEHEYSHWWNEQEQVVEFFPRHDKKPLKIMGTKSELKLDVGNGRRLQQLETRRILVDIHCPTFQLIAKILNRLESTAHIHVWEINGNYTIELPRMRLSFVVTGFTVHNNSSGSITITSQEYEGMKVDVQQQLETLVGLQQGLLLTNGVEKMFLIPYGTVHLNGHHSISISTKHLLQPPYFRYDVDERLGQLKAGETQTGWYYLAYLHAVTSSFVPDPFTGVTGTERAFQLLNSGVCFPSQPFSKETIQIVHLLRKLAPNRSYYPKHLQVMETIDWPTSISPLAAHDNFVDVVDILGKQSNRLAFLYDGVKKIKFEGKGAEILRSKANWRRAIICNGINAVETNTGRLRKTSANDFSFSAGGVICSIQLSHWCHLSRTELPNRDVFPLLTNLLLNKTKLSAGFGLKDLCFRTIRDWISVDFTNSWLGIYEAARNVKQSDRKYDWLLFLSSMAFRQEDRVNIDQLSILNAIAQHGEMFNSIHPPEYPNYSDTSQYQYDNFKIKAVLSSCESTSLDDYVRSHMYKKHSTETLYEFEKRMKPEYQHECEIDAAALEKGIRDHWPCEKISELISDRPADKHYDWQKARDNVNALFTKWFQNRALRMFLENVSTTLRNNFSAVHVVNTATSDLASSMLQVQDSTHRKSQCSPFLVRLEDFVLSNFENQHLDRCNLLFRGYVDKTDVNIISPKKRIDNFPLKEFTESKIRYEFIKDLNGSWDQWQLQKNLPNTEAEHPLGDRNCTSMDIWNYIDGSIKKNSELYFLSDWFPRVTPTTLLPLICKTFGNGTPMSKLRKLLGGYAVAITQEQHQCRIERYKRLGNELSLLEMKKESNNIGHSNWSPESRPEWILLEIENDFLIRPLQIKVAEHMQSPGDDKNCLMQMNMGEGKTAVIIPLLALSLADGKQLCRITVLRSLYQINLKSLSLKIGGLLLKRRVYTMPCRRDYPIEAGNVKKMMNAYQECLDEKGVLLTLPEHRLSFELKKHEKALAESYSDSMGINGVLNWLQANARDVLDESDEILQVKYQLLYTLGEPLTINGGSLRWTITQALLKLVPNRIKKLLEKEELQNQFELKVASNEQEFPHCRILSENAYDQLCTGICEDVIRIGLIPEPIPAVKNCVFKFLTQEILNRDEMQQPFEIPCYALQTQKDTMLILRGLLACGVLRSCLSKRWRVNYGVNRSGHRRMAVPFRAKDVAADRAEFGHPDVAIVLTLLSYYYSGLSNDQLEDAFTRLFRLNFAEEEYQTWTAFLPSTTPGLERIKTLSGINLRDYRQKYNVIFPAMRRNMATIDFWLGQAVFPVESKQFGSKIGCSAWDLCRDDNVHPTTGFSGTNDTKLLLPRPIQQRDLPELLGTNGKVLENLLRPENNHYEGLESHISAKQLIQKLVEGNIKVLLDVGAIMLELTNEKVADEWMAQSRDIEAVVFFDDQDYLLVKSRLAPRPIQFETSPFHNRLDSCGIYLDEIHTRGTDLKIPLGTTAVVTLGKGVRKDTLVQGCMRMRKLGEGHTIRFWGSSEVHPQIAELASESEPPGSYAVLKWAIHNSVHFLEEGFIHWAGSGTYELQKLSAKRICGGKEKESKLLAKLCSQNEVLELMGMYGLEKSLLTYPSIAKNMIDRSIEHLRLNLDGSSHSVCANEIDQDFKYMLQHLEKYVAQSRRTSNILDEEQERELEHELEEETEVEPPPKATAQKHVLNEQLRQFIKSGCKTRSELVFMAPSELLPLKNVFINSELRNFCKTATMWGNGSDFAVRATVDFERTVIQIFEKKSSDFLRPVMWIYNTIIEGLNFAILLSPYEVNECWYDFKTGQGTLHMYGPRLFRDQETLHESYPLMIPSRRGIHCSFPYVMTATLDILAGSFNFRNESDERAYCCVAGISAKPRSAGEERLFQIGGIVNGFIDPIQRVYLPMFSGVSVFEEHPERLIRGIIEARHGVFSEKSHVGNVIVYGRKNFTD